MSHAVMLLVLERGFLNPLAGSLIGVNWVHRCGAANFCEWFCSDEPTLDMDGWSDDFLDDYNF